MTRNDDISLILAKAKLNGMLPDVHDEELDAIQQYANVLFGDDGALSATYASIVNAVADGVTNASPAIQAALDAAGSIGGGTVTIPAKAAAYALAKTLFIPANVTIWAYGATLKGLSGCGALLSAKGQQTATMAPRVPTVTPSTTGGTLAAGAYTYYVTSVTAGGETMPTQASATTTGATGSVALSWTAATVLTGGQAIANYKVYRRNLDGTFVLLGSPAGTTFTDTGAAGTVSALPTTFGTFGRTAGINVFGGTWDTNKASNPSVGGPWQAAYSGMGLDFQKVDRLKLRDLTVMNADKWAIAVADYTYLTTDNITFNTGSDGIHVLGPGVGWRASGIQGTVGDDMVGMSAVEWPGYTVSEGSLTDIDIRNVTAENCFSVMRILGGTGTEISNVRMRGITGTVNPATAAAAALYVNDDQNNPGRAGTVVRGLTIEDVDLYFNAAKHLISFAATLVDNLNISKLRRTDTQTFTTIGFGAWNGIGNIGRAVISNSIGGTHLCSVTASGVVVDHLAIRDCKMSSATTAAAFTMGSGTVNALTVDGLILATDNSRAVSITGGTITSCTVRGIRATAGASTGCHGVQVNGAGAVITTLRVRDVEVTGAATTNAVVWVQNGTVNKGTISECFAANNAYILALDATANTTGIWNLRANDATGPGHVKTRVAVQLIFGGISGTAPTIACYSAFSGAVKIYGDGFLAGTITRDGTQLIRSYAQSLPVDVSILQRNNGDRATNNNAALACGSGPVISDGTNWKHLYTGAIY